MGIKLLKLELQERYLMKNKKKIFDTVKLMRDIRNSIHLKYEKNPELRKIELERIRKEYGIYADSNLSS